MKGGHCMRDPGGTTGATRCAVPAIALDPIGLDAGLA